MYNTNYHSTVPIPLYIQGSKLALVRWSETSRFCQLVVRRTSRNFSLKSMIASLSRFVYQIFFRVFGCFFGIKTEFAKSVSPQNFSTKIVHRTDTILVFFHNYYCLCNILAIIISHISVFRHVHTHLFLPPSLKIFIGQNFLKCLA